jgi:hypothetical protein
MGFCEGLRVRLAASVLVAVVAGSPLIRGQGPVEALGESWRWRVFDRREGLTSSNVSALYQDRHEFIYAATERGLSRYDLWEWTTLQTEKPFDDGPVKRFVESPSALFAVTANVVWRVQGGTSLAPFYRGGDLFAADNDLGEVYVIDALRERHLQVRGETAEPIDEVRLPAGKMLAYEIDAARNHWLATSDGLFRRDLGRRSWQEVDERSLDASLLGKRCVRFFRVGPAQAHDPEVEDMTGARPPGILWALFVAASASASGSDAPAQTLARLESGVWLTVGSLEGPLVEQICADLDAAFLATAEDGRLLASADGKEWRAVQALGIGKTALHGGLLDTSGILWFQNGAGGVVAFDSRSRSWEALSTGEGTTFPDVLTIAETEEGEIWLGMTRGVTRLRHGRKPETWERVLDTSLEKNHRHRGGRPPTVVDFVRGVVQRRFLLRRGRKPLGEGGERGASGPARPAHRRRQRRRALVPLGREAAARRLRRLPFGSFHLVRAGAGAPAARPRQRPRPHARGHPLGGDRRRAAPRQHARR